MKIAIAIIIALAVYAIYYHLAKRFSDWMIGWMDRKEEKKQKGS